MKNIHVLPTDKPSRLYSKDGNHKLDNSTMAMDWYISSAGYKPHDIYITNDEEVKEGDWYLYGKEIIQANGLIGFHPTIINACKKIILTDNQDLIKDGVQAIDDEFLKWFVKNPSCEEVEIKGINFVDSKIGIIKNHRYKIIIPKEELKQETVEEFTKEVLNEEFFTNISEYRKAERLIELGVKWNQENILELLRSNGYEDEPIFDLINNYLKS